MNRKLSTETRTTYFDIFVRRFIFYQLFGFWIFRYVFVHFSYAKLLNVPTYKLLKHYFRRKTIIVVVLIIIIYNWAKKTVK